MRVLTAACILTAHLTLAWPLTAGEAPNHAGKTNALPFAYFLPAAAADALTNLQARGLEVLVLREDLEIATGNGGLRPARAPKTDAANTAKPAAKKQKSTRVPAGSLVVKTDQKQGRDAAKWLERIARHGWENSPAVSVGRLREPVSLLTTPARPLPEKHTTNQVIRYATVHGNNPVNFSGSPTRVEWLKDGRHFLQTRSGRLEKVEALTGRGEPLIASNAVYAALQQVPGMDDPAAAAFIRNTRPEGNPDQTGALIRHENDLYFVRYDGSQAVRLTFTPEPEELATFSPDGRWIAFVRADNLYVVDIATQTERALTTDGGGQIRNGKADWVYFEEINNRDWKAYWWSPDSRMIAFEQFDASHLPTFHALNTLPLHGRLESMRHPKAGDPNPVVRLGVVSVAGGSPRWVDLGDYAPGSYVISEVNWFPGSGRVYCYVQDRIQSWLDFVAAPARGGRAERLYREKSPAWIESPGPARFLENGDFLMLSDRSGWKHLYRFCIASKTWKTLTSGEWEVRKIQLIDEQRGWIYFTGTRESAIAENLYRCALDGSNLERLTAGEGTHRVSVDPTGSYFVDSRSDYRTPESATLHRTDGTFVRTLDLNPVWARQDYRWGQVELFQIPSRDGFLFEAAMTKPVDFDPARRYPVWFTTYGGPQAPSIRNAWSGSWVEDQMLANLGLVVFRMDPRSASGKGSCHAWKAYRQLGVQELADITEAITWLKQQPFIDGSRVGMSGHSYGGFMTAYALTHSQLFAAGIAGAPVTDWRFYDSIYTERYMDLPQNNPSGYAASSVVEAAGQLYGRLLLLHGMMDDNVHLQNATRLMDALQKSGKQFEVMFYPEMLHGLYGKHYHQLIVDFIRRSLQLPDSSPP